uniref:Uncharacterized protein n=1 Tax=Oryza rufipogon TaxID=4529 RepID=A0A0E0P0J6_ORYRU
MNRRGLRKALALLGPKTRGAWRAWREERGVVVRFGQGRSIGRAASAFSFSHFPLLPSCPASSAGAAPHVRGSTDGDRRPYPYRPRRTSPSGSGIIQQFDSKEKQRDHRGKKKGLGYKHIQIQAGPDVLQIL